MNDENKDETLQNGAATGSPEETPLTAAQEKASEKAIGKAEKSSVKTYICKRACFFEQLYKEGEEMTTDKNLDPSLWDEKV